ncbi:TAXI family TRAP transporter solute-binding subunit [candidate division KSB1 bacterium]|nr:TAXI family TRAP transporter solute-binding subunit [candidate division KSB1 bacterium]
MAPKISVKLVISLIVMLQFCFYSCFSKRVEYRIAAGSSGTSYHDVGKHIAEILQKQTHYDVRVLSKPVLVDGDSLKLSAINNCRILSEGLAEFAISQNDLPLHPASSVEGTQQFSSLRSVIPLYSQIFFIIYKDALNPKSLKDLIVGREVAMDPEQSGTAYLTKILLKEFGIDTSQYKQKYVSFEDNMLCDSIDICCLLTGFNNTRIEKSISHGGKIFSLGEYSLAGKGSTADGFCLKYPMAKPYIIPKNIYSDLPEEPVLTVAIDAVLLTRKDIKHHVVYDFMHAILNNKQFLVIDLNNKLLSQLTEQFDPLSLRFPLHPGAKAYLERDQPSFFERYAELLGFIFSIFIAFVGGVTTLARWNRHRKKNRIDAFYNQIMEIQHQIKAYTSVDACYRSIEKLRQLRQDAFSQLIKEKLSADNSFGIFIAFLNDTQNDLRSRIDELRNVN